MSTSKHDFSQVDRVKGAFFKAFFVLTSALLVFESVRNSLTWHLSQFWGGVGDVWQLLWDKLLAVMGNYYFINYSNFWCKFSNYRRRSFHIGSLGLFDCDQYCFLDSRIHLFLLWCDLNAQILTQIQNPTWYQWTCGPTKVQTFGPNSLHQHLYFWTPLFHPGSQTLGMAWKTRLQSFARISHGGFGIFVLFDRGGDLLLLFPLGLAS